MVSCHHFPSNPQLPLQMYIINAIWPVPNYTAIYPGMCVCAQLGQMQYVMKTPGLKPMTYQLQVQCPNHFNTKMPYQLNNDLYLQAVYSRYHFCFHFLPKTTCYVSYLESYLYNYIS